MKQYNGEKYIVSFTSFGNRMVSAIKMIFSLTNQTYKNFHLVLTLYKDDAEKMPEMLETLIDNELLELIVADQDLGPHLKYYYAMQKYWDKPIITLDDDRIYSVTEIEKLVKKYSEVKYKSVISGCAIEMQRTSEGKLLPYPDWCKFRLKEDSISNIAMAEGFAGVLYPPRCFKNLDSFIPDILKCKYDDDLFLKVAEIRENIPVTQCSVRFDDRIEAIDIEESMKYNLHNNQNKGNINRVNMCKLFEKDLLKGFDNVLHIE